MCTPIMDDQMKLLTKRHVALQLWIDTLADQNLVKEWLYKVTS